MVLDVLNLTRVHPHLCSERGLAPSPSCKTQPHHYRSLFTLLSFLPLCLTKSPRRTLPLFIHSSNQHPSSSPSLLSVRPRPTPLPQPRPIITTIVHSFISCPLFSFSLTIAAIYPVKWKRRFRFSPTLPTIPLRLPRLYLVTYPCQ